MPGRIVGMTGQSLLPDAPPGLSVLEAVLERITYANEDTGYTIARVATDFMLNLIGYNLIRIPKLVSA